MFAGLVNPHKMAVHYSVNDEEELIGALNDLSFHVLVVFNS
jgi:hypothetical protein